MTYIFKDFAEATKKQVEYAYQDFATFSQGLKELVAISSSVRQCLEIETPEQAGELDEGQIVARLACNVVFDRPTGNGVDWGLCNVRVSAYGCRYSTRGGLEFGWIREPDWTYGFRFERREKPYRFFLSHPTGTFPEGSTLKASALEVGWEIGVLTYDWANIGLAWVVVAQSQTE